MFIYDLLWKPGMRRKCRKPAPKPIEIELVASLAERMDLAASFPIDNSKAASATTTAWRLNASLDVDRQDSNLIVTVWRAIHPISTACR